MTDFRETIPDVREDKLPKWAQTNLRVLRMRLSEANERINENAGEFEGAVVFTDNYAATPRPVAKVGETVRFFVNDRDYANVKVMKDGILEVNASRGVFVQPRATNHLWLKIES